MFPLITWRLTGNGGKAETGWTEIDLQALLRRRRTAGVNISAKPFSRQRGADSARGDKGMSKEEED